MTSIGNGNARLSRRNVLKSGAALGLAGIGLKAGFAIRPAGAANIKVNIVTPRAAARSSRTSSSRSSGCSRNTASSPIS
jgi:hypothetical protein